MSLSGGIFGSPPTREGGCEAEALRGSSAMPLWLS